MTLCGSSEVLGRVGMHESAFFAFRVIEVTLLACIVSQLWGFFLPPENINSMAPQSMTKCQ